MLGVVFESTVWPGRAPAGQALLRCILGGARDPRALELGDAELVEIAHRDVTRALAMAERGGRAHASVIRLAARSRAICGGSPRSRCVMRSRVRGRDGSRFAGADYRGAGINDLCADADVVTAEVCSWT